MKAKTAAGKYNDMLLNTNRTFCLCSTTRPLAGTYCIGKL